MKQFVFIKSATDVVAIPASALLRYEYTSDTSISLHFKTTSSGKDATTVVVLSVSSGKAKDVISNISSNASSGIGVVLFDDVNNTFTTSDITGVSSITTTEGPAETVPSGGSTGEFLKKVSDTDYDVEWSDVRDLYIQVRNDSGGDLDKGTPVHAIGVTGTVADVIAARADTASAMPATYVLNEDIADGEQGQAIIVGEITGVDTSSFSPGDVVYVGATGGFTNVKPTGTNLIQNLGVVTKSNANTGSGVVYGSGRSNDLPNLAEGMMWVGDSNGVPQQQSAKTYGSITCGFFDDISTLVHYLPLNGPPTEINSDNNSYTDWLCPCDIVVKSVQMRFSSLTGAGNLTMTVEKDAIGSGVDTDVESETVAISGSGDIQDVVHFLFDNAAVSAGEKLKIKIQADVDITGSSNTFVVVVYEADWSTRYTQASGIITS